MTTHTDIASIRLRAEASIDGQWVVTGKGDAEQPWAMTVHPEHGTLSNADAYFVTRAREDALVLLAEIDRLGRGVAALLETHPHEATCALIEMPDAACDCWRQDALDLVAPAEPAPR